MTCENTVSSDRLSGLSPVNRLLLTCLKPRLSMEARHRLAHLSERDWDALARQAIGLNVGAFFYHRLQETPSVAQVPQTTAAMLRDVSRETAVHNLQLLWALNGVLKGLQAVAIPVIVLKGAYLVQSIYGSVGQRPMVDVDILVREDDIGRCDERLRQLGYRYHETSEEAAHHLLYTTPDAEKQLIEVHWRISPPQFPFAVPMEGLWSRAQPFRTGGIETLALSLEDLLLHLCYHDSYHHRYYAIGLKNLVDVAEIVRQKGEDIDWTMVEARAQGWGIAKGVYLTLHLAKTLLEVPIPTSTLKNLEPHDGYARVLPLAQRRVFLEANNAGPWSDNLGRLLSSENLVGKVVALLTSVFPPRRRLAETYSLSPQSAKIYLCYLAHWGHLLRVHGGSLCLLILRDESARRWVRREAERITLEDWLNS